MNDTIVLINNNKYGAPELKKLQKAFTIKGLIVAVTIHIALIAAYMLIGYINQSKAKDIPFNPKTPVIITDVEFTPPPIDEQEIPPVKKEEIVDKVKDLASLQPEPVKKKDADNVVLKTQDELNNINVNTSRDGDSLIVMNTNNGNTSKDPVNDKIDNVIKDNNNNTNTTYDVSNVDVVPECINLGQVKGSLVYPELARETGIEGRVTAKVLVGPEGNVLKIGSVTGPDVFHDEVKDKAKNLQFTPGLQSNKPVKVWVTVPFSFKLQ